ncbi:MAG: hypothetical protein PHG04_00095 [Candidatus Nanoarchaeia archaeon]|nr:hypothetical protein [Candidatus Nanoarchaeia archaeon]MDD5053765.1 hypothetical protein [Candidatus Nanoarchaeia archaeon]
MIKVSGNDVIIEADSEKEYSKFLWEVLDLMSNRFTILAFAKKKARINYDKMEKLKIKSDEIILMQCDSQNDFIKAISELSGNLMHDFYITVNSSIKTIKSMIEENENFTIEWYLSNFPKTIHVQEEGFKISLDTFSNYDFQIERIVKRFN